MHYSYDIEQQYTRNFSNAKVFILASQKESDQNAPQYDIENNLNAHKKSEPYETVACFSRIIPYSWNAKTSYRLCALIDNCGNALNRSILIRETLNQSAGYVL